MTTHVSARDAQNQFTELTDRVHDSGEPMIVEREGQPLVAVVRPEDLVDLERFRASARRAEFTRLAAGAAREEQGPELTEEEIVEAVRKTREAIYRERYSGS